MSTCKNPFEAPHREEWKVNSLNAVLKLLDDDNALQCPLLLDESINPTNANETRKVQDCIGQEECTASAYDGAVLDRLVVCSAAYENLTSADCKNNTMCSAVQSYVKQKYNADSMEQMSQQRRKVSFDQDQWSRTPGKAPVLTFDNDQPLYITPGAGLCFPDVFDIGMGYAKTPDDENVQSVTFKTVVPWTMVYGGNVIIRTVDGPLDSSPLGAVADETADVPKDTTVLITGDPTVANYPLFSVIRAEVNKQA